MLVFCVLRVVAHLICMKNKLSHYCNARLTFKCEFVTFGWTLRPARPLPNDSIATSQVFQDWNSNRASKQYTTAHITRLVITSNFTSYWLSRTGRNSKRRQQSGQQPICDAEGQNKSWQSGLVATDSNLRSMHQHNPVSAWQRSALWSVHSEPRRDPGMLQGSTERKPAIRQWIEGYW